MHGSVLPVTIPPPPPRIPRDKSSPSGPGVGNCLKRFCPGGEGAGQVGNNLILSCEACHFSVDTMVLDRVEKTAYFQEKSLEFVADWLEKNNLSKLKYVFEGMFYYKLLNESAFDAYSNG